jgi:DNA-binding transcriptional regulator LsrR (DeoR family)
LLDEAMSRGIVRVTVVERVDFGELGHKLIARFALRLARVSSSSSDYEEMKLNIGRTAAIAFDELVAPGTTVGIGGGGSLKAMVDALRAHPSDIRVIPKALVGRGPDLEYVDSAFLAELLCYKSGPKARALFIQTNHLVAPSFLCCVFTIPSAQHR